MATSPALIEALVAMTGETKASVSVILTRLRKAGLIPVGGRGPYAIAMDEEAAMRLLIAICASVPLEPDSAATAIARFEGLCSSTFPKIESIKSEEYGSSIVMPLDELRESHTVGEALKHLLKVAGQEELFTFIDPDTGKRRRGYTNPDVRGYLQVEFMMPLPLVTIQHALTGWIRKTWIYGQKPHNFDDLERYRGLCREAYLGDRTRVTSISHFTLEEIGVVLRS